MRLWTDVNEYMVTRPGYLSHGLHRSLPPGAHLRVLDHGVCREAADWAAAHACFPDMLSRSEWAPFTSTPALYEVVHVGTSAVSTLKTGPVFVGSGASSVPLPR